MSILTETPVHSPLVENPKKGLEKDVFKQASKLSKDIKEELLPKCSYIEKNCQEVYNKVTRKNDGEPISFLKVTCDDRRKLAETAQHTANQVMTHNTLLTSGFFPTEELERVLAEYREANKELTTLISQFEELRGYCTKMQNLPLSHRAHVIQHVVGQNNAAGFDGSSVYLLCGLLLIPIVRIPFRSCGGAVYKIFSNCASRYAPKEQVTSRNKKKTVKKSRKKIKKRKFTKKLKNNTSQNISYRKSTSKTYKIKSETIKKSTTYFNDKNLLKNPPVEEFAYQQVRPDQSSNNYDSDTPSEELDLRCHSDSTSSSDEDRDKRIDPRDLPENVSKKRDKLKKTAETGKVVQIIKINKLLASGEKEDPDSERFHFNNLSSLLSEESASD